MNVTRKEFLTSLLRGAGSLTVIGSACALGHLLLRKPSPKYPVSAEVKQRPLVRLIRPPGALAEKRFLAACIRCYRCQDACDIGAIRFFTEADGLYFQTPYVDPAVKSCNLCMRCTKMCPTGALQPMEVKERSKVAMASVELRKDLCLSYKAKAIRNEQALLMDLGKEPTESDALIERRGPCGECYMFCPVRDRAIRLEPGSFLAPIIFTEHCVGCGMCEDICRVMVKGDPAIRVVPTRQRI